MILTAHVLVPRLLDLEQMVKSRISLFGGVRHLSAYVTEQAHSRFGEEDKLGHEIEETYRNNEY